MAGEIDLTPFGFTPTESMVYRVLLEHGPGTGYAVAKAAGLARANAYSALEGLVSKGAAAAGGDKPRRYRPEAARTLVARLAARQSQELDGLAAALEGFTAIPSPALVEIESPRAALRLISHDVARAERMIELVAPPDAYPILGPVLRRAVSAGLGLELWSAGGGTEPVSLNFVEVGTIAQVPSWPATPLISVVDDSRAVIASRSGSEVEGHWGTSPTFVAAARAAVSSVVGR